MTSDFFIIVYFKIKIILKKKIKHSIVPTFQFLKKNNFLIPLNSELRIEMPFNYLNKNEIP